MKMIEVMRNERRDTIYGTHLILSLEIIDRYVSKNFFGKIIIALFSKKTIANM
jgi:hypothetical protein